MNRPVGLTIDQAITIASALADAYLNHVRKRDRRAAHLARHQGKSVLFIEDAEREMASVLDAVGALPCFAQTHFDRILAYEVDKLNRDEASGRAA